MIRYPSILSWSNIESGQNCIAFDKLDGSNLRFQYNPKKGWYKFGTRRRVITPSDENFGEGIEIFKNKYSKQLERIFKSEKDYRHELEITVFCEYLGENSFAGSHDKDDEKDLILFDIYKSDGFVNPSKFIKHFGKLHIPKVIYKGEFNEYFVDKVKRDDFNLKEGVICKGVKNKNVWYCKIKTEKWLNKVKSMYGIESLQEFGE